MVQRDDAELVATALAGGPEAFNPIVERYRGHVYGVALARLCHFDEAEDVAQQVFIEAYAGLHTLRDPERLGPWLRTAAIHRSIDSLRQRRAHLELGEVAAELTTDWTPEIEWENSQRREQVLTAIGRLSEVQRETTMLYYMGGHSVEAVATMQEIPVGTVKRRLHEARSRLKTELVMMLEGTLQNESPSGDFSEQVSRLITRYHQNPGPWCPMWSDIHSSNEPWDTEMATLHRSLAQTAQQDLPQAPSDLPAIVDPDLFAHGKLLRRFKGSEACRFSTRIALNILKHLKTGSEPQLLWDPFCGTGLIPSVGLFAYAGLFDAVIASDINPQAVQCARANMGLFSEPGGLEQRLHEVRVRQRAYVKQHEHWGAVARYIEKIRPVVYSQRKRLPPCYAFTSSALALPPLRIKGQIHFISDLPYGTMCRLQGGTLDEVIPRILQAYPDAKITFVLLRESLKEIHLDGSRRMTCRPLKKGRVILRV